VPGGMMRGGHQVINGSVQWSYSSWFGRMRHLHRALELTGIKASLRMRLQRKTADQFCHSAIHIGKIAASRNIAE
jgi:hypothetical protein